MGRYAAAPGELIYAVGDIHGHLHELETLMAAVRTDRERSDRDARLIFLGDYVDRGPQSRGVLAYLRDGLDDFADKTFLRGNHEASMLGFMDQPEDHTAWLDWGGLETLASYGVPADNQSTPRQLAEGLAAAMPAADRRFLEAMPLMERSGDLVFVHAGVRPDVPLDRQNPHDLTMIRRDFLNNTKDPGFCVVHGHTPADKPVLNALRVGIDTGVYMTGVITAARLEGRRVDFIQNTPRQHA